MYLIVALLSIPAFAFVVFRHQGFTLFSKSKTLLLKAVLPYLIFVHHTHVYDADFYYVGAFVVSLFFFISGYGLESKRMAGLARIGDLPKAVKKLMVPLIVPVVIYLAIRLLNDPFEVVVRDIAKYQVVLPYTWFVVTLIILYILFYGCLVLRKKYCSKDLYFYLFIISAVLLFSIFGKFAGVPSWARNTTTAFLAGLFYKHYEPWLMKRVASHVYASLFVIVSLLLVVTIYIKGDIFEYEQTILTRPLLAFLWSAVFVALYAFWPTVDNPAVRYVSSMSYELYICQSIGFLLLGDKSQFAPSVYLFLCFVVCTVVAVVCKSLTGFIFQRK